jgi:nitrous oxide reductase accessory protein NosL
MTACDVEDHYESNTPETPKNKKVCFFCSMLLWHKLGNKLKQRGTRLQTLGNY